MFRIATSGENNTSRISILNDNDEDFFLVPTSLAKTHLSRLLFKNRNLLESIFYDDGFC